MFQTKTKDKFFIPFLKLQISLGDLDAKVHLLLSFSVSFLLGPFRNELQVGSLPVGGGSCGGFGGGDSGELCAVLVGL